MDLKQFVQQSLGTTRFQVEGVFRGLSDPDANFKVSEHSMSPAECLAHLTECCVAFITISEGGEHNWGTFVPKGKTLAELQGEWSEAREKCEQLVQNQFSDSIANNAMDYLALHEAYHVGQMATIRNSLGNWDPYSLYAGH